MRIAERVLIVSFGSLLVAAIALCWFNANSPESFSRGDTTDAVPWQAIWAQVAFSAASTFALVGFAAVVALLFLKAARWTAQPVDDREVTPQPSP